jgi:hypothetical protein
MSEPTPPDETRAASDVADRLSASVDEIEAAIETAMARLEAARKTEAAAAAAEAAHKQQITRRVSISALLLTMMLSFLGFVRAKSDKDANNDKTVATQSRNDAATEWSLYQAKAAQRSGFLEAQDALAREVLSLPAGDPRRRLVRFHHHEYEDKVRQLDDESGQVFFAIQALNRREYLALKDAEHHDRRTDRYDMGIRTLTLALVLISVTLLVDRAFLFWFGLLVASIGATFGVTGYFLR